MARREKVGQINGKLKIPTAVETGFLAIDEDGGLIVDGSEMEQNALGLHIPVLWQSKVGGEPGVDGGVPLDAG